LVFLVMGSLLNIMNSAQQNLSSQEGRDDFRGLLLEAFDHPALCLSLLNGPSPLASTPTVFNAAEAALTSTTGLNEIQATGTFGMPLNLTLGNSSTGVGNTVIKSPDPANFVGKKTLAPFVPLPKFNIAYQYILFQNAVQLGQDPTNPQNTLWQGAVTLVAQKLSGTNSLTDPIMGGNALPQVTIGSLVLSVNGNSVASCQGVPVVNDICTTYGGVPNPSPVPGGPQCLIKGPCSPGSVFGGIDPITQVAVCNIVPTTCPPGQGLVPNGTGSFICQTP
jgi:hypothetical protein